MNLGKLVPMCLSSIHRCIPSTIQRKALQTRTSKMENYEKCWLHQCICRIEKTMNPLECQSHRRNLLHCFHSDVKNREINSRVLFSKTLTRQIREDLFLKAIKIICSVRHIKLDLSVTASVSFSNKLMLKDWNYRTLNTDILSLHENKYVHPQEELIMKDTKVLRDTQIRSMHEMGEMKRARELRVDEVSQCKKKLGKS